MKLTLRSASSVAIIAGLAGTLPAWAQQADQQQQNQTVTTQQAGQNQRPDQTGQPSPAGQQAPAEQQASDARVVITGSLIPTTREDAPKPVEVFTREEMQEQGSPSIGEFLRDLTVAFDSPLGLGEAEPDNLGYAGFNSPDLRGLGPNATLSLINGRRLASTNGGDGADINTIPQNALAQVEILRTGASTTYGAGAVGGAINFVTRRDVNAPEITLEHRAYDGSDGQWNVDFLTGWVGDAGNLLVSYEYEHTEAMKQSERDFASLPRLVNPDVWSMDPSNPGKYVRTTNYWSGNPAFPSGPFNPDRQIYDFRSVDDCTAIGGGRANVIEPNRPIPGTPNDSFGAIPDLACATPQYRFVNLVDEQTNHRLFVEMNTDISDTMEVHIETLYSKSETISQGMPISPTNSNSRGVMALSSEGLGANPVGFGSSTLCGTTHTACNFVIPVEVRTYTDEGVQNTASGTAVRNPFIDDFIARTGAGLLPTDALYTGIGWRPFLFGGNPHYGNGPNQTTAQRERFQINAAVRGEFTSEGVFGFLDSVNYDYSAQYNQYLQTDLFSDVVTSRLQDALRGYGGPGCKAIDRVPTDFSSNQAYNRTVGIQSDMAPGANGCQFFNPFASAFPVSAANGAANPQYNAALPANSPELINWLFRDRSQEWQTQSVTFDATWNGQIDENLFTLPGGEIGWAAGVQWRQVEARSFPRSDTELARMFDTQLCPWPDPQMVGQGRTAPGDLALVPGQMGCRTGTGESTTPGAFLTSDEGEVDYGDEQALAYYGEVQLPVLDNLNFLGSWRHEEYNGGDLEGDIWNVSGKWDITDNFYVRGDYGTNFRAQGLDAQPGEIEVSNFTLERFEGHVIDLFDLTDTSIGPEDDTTINIGVGYQSRDLLGGRLDASIDFFETVIDGQLVGGAGDDSPLTIVLNSVFGPSQSWAATPVLTGPGQGCNSPLRNFLIFNNNNTCTPGATVGSDLVGLTRMLTNGGGLVTNGLDYQASYRRPLFDGTLGLSFRATQVLVYKQRGYDIGGIPFDPGGDRLGLRNGFASGGSSAREFRANATVSWSNKDHTISLRAKYDQGIWDPGYLACLAPYYDAATGTQVSRVGNFYSCGDNLTAVFRNPDGTAMAGVDAYSSYGVHPEDRTVFDLTYIYRPPFAEGLQFRGSVLNLTDEDPAPDQTRRGFFSGDPRGRVFELEVKKAF